MKLKTRLLGCFGLLSVAVLTACTTVQQGQAVAALEAAYTVDAQVATQYINGSLGIPPASDVVANIKLADNLAKERLDVLRTAAQNGTAVSSVESLAAMDAVTAFTTLLQKLGLIKDTTTTTTTSN